MKVDRRAFGKFVVGGLVAGYAQSLAYSPIVSEDEAQSKTSLLATRDLLLPGLWMITADYAPDFESDIIIDFKSDALIVKAYQHSTKKQLGFAITRGSITSGRYKAEFVPSMKRLFQVLEQEA